MYNLNLDKNQINYSNKISNYFFLDPAFNGVKGKFRIIADKHKHTGAGNKRK